MTARRVLVTRPAGQAEELAALLRYRGLEPVVVPTVSIDTTSTRWALGTMRRSLDTADWLVLTSANGAAALVATLDGGHLPSHLRVAAVGPATADALRAGGIRVDHVPEDHLTVAIAGGLGEVRGRRIVLARADAATRDLRDALIHRGARVDEVVAYRTVEAPVESRDRLRAALDHRLDAIAFSSGSTVRGLVRLADADGLARLRSTPACCIGPVTADVARGNGFDVRAVAARHTAAGLAGAVADHLLMEDR